MFKDVIVKNITRFEKDDELIYYYNFGATTLGVN